MTNENTLIQIIDRLNYAIIICDIDSNFISWNKKAEELISIKEDKANANANLWKKYFNITNTDGSKVEINDYPIIKALNGKTTIGDRLIITNENMKEPIVISIDSFPVEEHNKIVGAVTVFSDISDRIKMEKILDEVTDSFKHIKRYLENSLMA